MQVLTMLSAHPGSGQLTVLVNLASGLVRQGKRVLIAQLGFSPKLLNWLGVATERKFVCPALSRTPEELTSQIIRARFGIDMLNVPVFSGEPNFIEMLQSVMNQLGYSYLILNLSPTLPEAYSLIPAHTRVLVCTDLRTKNESAEIQKLQRKLQLSHQTKLLQTGAQAFPEISLIIPSRINTKDWKRNNEQLSALGEYFGYEKLVDPLPT